MLSPGAVFVLLLIIGIAAGLLFDRLVGPGWLSRQIAGPNRMLVTSALHRGLVRGLPARACHRRGRLWRAPRRRDRRAGGAVGLARRALMVGSAFRASRPLVWRI
jgi:hypothetical protein